MTLLDFQNQPLWLNLAIFAAAAVVVWIGGARLARTADAIAVKTGLGQAFAGMLLLGLITPLPEMANVITASAGGVPQLAVNNLLGSVAINLVLLAVADALIGREAVTSAVAGASTMMMCTLCTMVLGVVAVAVAVGDVAVLGVGLWSAAICGLSIGAYALAAGYGGRAPWTVADRRAAVSEEAGDGGDAPLAHLLAVTFGIGVVIFASGYTLSETGEAIADQTGLGAGLVGFVLIGLATSLPEFSTIMAAVRLRRYDMAFGQVLGTNFVNLALILLSDVVFRGGPVIDELGRFEIVSALLGLTLIGVFQVGLLERRNPTVLKMGYDSLVVMVLYAGGVGLLYLVR